MKTLLLTTLLLFCSMFVFCQPEIDTSKAKIDSICDQFMETFSKGSYSKAIQSLKKKSFIDEEKLTSSIPLLIVKWSRSGMHTEA